MEKEEREANEENEVLKVKHLKAFYVLEIWGERKIIQAVNGVDLKVSPNTIYGIAGESGCGKTTLLKTLFATIEPPLRLFEGKVYYQNNGEYHDALSLNPMEMRTLRWTYISYIPQGSMSVFNPVRRIKLTFLDVLESHVQEKVTQELLLLAIQHLKDLGLTPQVLDAYPHQLSGGMRQRVAIALATLLKPRLILADEPTTALDVVAQRVVLQLLQNIQRELRNTIVLVTHDMGIHAQITTHLAIMYAGRIVEEGPTEEVFIQPFHPYTQYLIHSLPHIGEKSHKESIPGSPPSLLVPFPGCSFHPRCPHTYSHCTEEVPMLQEISPQHKVACFLWRKNHDLS
jgi:peptide/nickel transport system ATP-binding protein